LATLGPLQTGGDFYNFFVLGLLPDSYDPDLIDNNSINITALEEIDGDSSGAAPISSEPACGSWFNLAYPECADTSQNDLGTYGGGFVSGYFLNSTNVAVLSIPSFNAEQEEASSFESAILDFITKSQKANMKKVVIDLQSNFGGSPLVATDAFKRFFPNINPFEGSRLRAHPAANVMGNTITEYFRILDNTTELFRDLIKNDWVATTKINADTNQLFTTWSEEFGGPHANGDNFTTTQRYDFADIFFDYTAVDDPNQNFTVFGFGSNPAPANATPAYSAEDIIIVSLRSTFKSNSLTIQSAYRRNLPLSLYPLYRNDALRSWSPNRGCGWSARARSNARSKRQSWSKHLSYHRHGRRYPVHPRNP
jgi:hypothetical protein